VTVADVHNDVHMEIHLLEAVNVPAGGALNVDFNLNQGGRFVGVSVTLTDGTTSDPRPPRFTNQSSTEIQYGTEITNARLQIFNDSGSIRSFGYTVMVWIKT